MLTIWGRPNSHNVKKVLWFADELGLSYRREDVGGEFGMDADYLALNPNALIPTIDDEGFVLWESNAILRYLAARYGGERFWPVDPRVRALSDRWMDWQQTYAVAQSGAFFNLVRKTPTERNPAAIEQSAEAAGKMMLILDRQLAATPWLSGEDFGVADVSMGVYTHTFFTLDIERPDVPHLSDWYHRLQARAGYASHVMIPLT